MSRRQRIRGIDRSPHRRVRRRTKRRGLRFVKAMDRAWVTGILPPMPANLVHRVAHGFTPKEMQRAGNACGKTDPLTSLFVQMYESTPRWMR